MSNPYLPDNVSEFDPAAPWNQGMSDEDIASRRQAAKAGLFHLNELSDILEELGLYVSLVAVKEAMEDMI